MRLFSSEVALQTALALACADRLSLTTLSRATAAPPSSTKRALEILMEDEYTTRSGSVYALCSSPAAALLSRLAAELLGPATVIGIAARATGQIEYAGQDQDQLLVIFVRASDP